MMKGGLKMRLGAFALCALLAAGCGGGSASNSAAMAGGPAPADVMRVGDKITVQLSGVPGDGDYFNEKQIPPGGDITLPLLTQSFKAAGRPPSELANEISEAYKSQKIYTNPVVVVLEEERYVNVGGDVRSPSNVIFRPDSTVMSTINLCGGFTDFADRRHVRVVRGGQVFYVDCVRAVGTPGADPAVFPADQIYVPRTPF
jgi:protein involved in polysaccharide export with SLBB domain